MPNRAAEKLKNAFPENPMKKGVSSELHQAIILADKWDLMLNVTLVQH